MLEKGICSPGAIVGVFLWKKAEDLEALKVSLDEVTCGWIIRLGLEEKCGSAGHVVVIQGRRRRQWKQTAKQGGKTKAVQYGGNLSLGRRFSKQATWPS